MNASAIIVAAGSGRRFGGAKQFALLNGKPLYLWSVEVFKNIKDIKKIVLVLPSNRLREIAGNLKNDKKILCVSGGKERFESVANGLKRISEETEIIAIHDAARPLVSPSIITLCLKAAQKYGAAIPAIPPSDTIKITDRDGGFIARTIPRSYARLIQTPQVFRREIILKAYSSFVRKSRGAKKDSAATDDSYFVEKLGFKVKVVSGEENNFKITTPADIVRAESILAKL